MSAPRLPAATTYSVSGNSSTVEPDELVHA